MKRKTVQHLVRRNIHEEKEAITGYKKAAKDAKKVKDTKAAKVFTHIQKDETHHLKELKKLKK